MVNDIRRKSGLPEGIDALLITKPSNRRYLSAFSGSSGSLLINGDNIRYLFVDTRYSEQAAQEASYFNIMIQKNDEIDCLADVIKNNCIKTVGIEKDHVTIKYYEELKKRIPNIEFIAIDNPWEKDRKIKKSFEIEQIKAAVQIADKTFDLIAKKIKVGMTERELSIMIDTTLRECGAEKNSFDTIVSSGKRTSLPHGMPSDKEIFQGDLVMLDFGAVYCGYCSDLTRTLIIGEPDEHQTKIYELVLRAQNQAIAQIKSGVSTAFIDSVARNIIDKAGYKEYFGHGLGHSLGLEIHEEPRLSPLDSTVLAPGMIITVEPGVYLPGWGGIRIEDVVLVREDDCEILSQSPKDIKDVIIKP